MKTYNSTQVCGSSFRKLNACILFSILVLSGNLSLAQGSDFCESAQVIDGFDCFSVNLAGATESGTLPYPTCTGSGTCDVWLASTVGDMGMVTIVWDQFSTGGLPSIQALTGTCDNLTEVECIEFNSDFPSTVFAAPPNSLLYIRAFTGSGCTDMATSFCSIGLPSLALNLYGEAVGGKNQLFGNLDINVSTERMEIERVSKDGEWSTLTTLDLPPSNSPQEFAFTDNYPYPQCYYRLKRTNIDGSVRYSDVIYIENTQTIQNLHLFPNPTSDIINIEGYHDTILAKLYDMQGNLLQVVNTSTLSLKQYPTGMYMLSIDGKAYKIFKE